MRRGQKSFEAYQAEDIERQPKFLYVIGLSSDKPAGVCDDLQELLKITIKPSPYLKNLTLSHEAIEYLSGDKGGSFFDIITTLSAAEDMRVNLMPEEAKLKILLEKRAQDFC